MYNVVLRTIKFYCGSYRLQRERERERERDKEKLKYNNSERCTVKE